MLGGQKYLLWQVKNTDVVKTHITVVAAYSQNLEKKV